MSSEWLKTGGFVLVIMIFWDIIRLFLQSQLNRFVMGDNFGQIKDDINRIINKLEDVEDDIENIHENINEDKNE